MTAFKVHVRPYTGRLSGNPDSAYSVERLDGELVGIVSRKNRAWVAWDLNGTWHTCSTRREGIQKLGGQA